MKKSQILAAIALAFALGVVAPVAGTYANGPMRIAGTQDEAEKTTAKDTEVKAAVNYVKGNSTYVAYEKLVKGVADITAAKIGADGATAYASIDVAADAVKGAMNTLKISYNTGASLDSLITTVTTDGDYTKWVALINAIANAKKAASDATDGEAFNALYKAITDIDPKAKLGENDNIAALIKFAETDHKLDGLNNKTEATLKNYTDLYTAVKMANNTKDLNKAMREGLEAAGIEIDDDVDTLAELSALAQGTAQGDVTANDANATKYGNWAAVVSGVNSVETDLKDNIDSLSPEDLYKLIDSDDAPKGLLQLMKAATGNNKLTVADLLAGAITTPDTPATTTTISSENGLATITGKFEAGKYSLDAAVYKEAIAALKDFKYGAYDINLKDAKGNVVNPEGTVTVTIKAPEGIDGTKARVYHVNDEGKLDLVKDSKYDKDAKTFTFTTNHFSIYAVVEDNNVLVPGAGVLNIKDNNASTAVSIMAGIATALTAAGAGIVAYRNARRSKEA